MARTLTRRKTQRRSAVKPSVTQVKNERYKNEPIDSTPMVRYINAYCEALLVRGFSPITSTWRRQMTRLFARWAHERGITDPREVTKPIVERYQSYLYYYRKPDGAPLTPESQANMIKAVQGLFSWLTRENHLLYNPASELELPLKRKRLPLAGLTPEEVEAILNEADPSTAEGLRDRAMLELIYSTALRRTEVANLTRFDVDMTHQLLYVRQGKGGRDRVVPIGARAVAWLDKYLLESRPKLVPLDDSYLFVTDYGERTKPDYVAGRVRRYMAFAGIDKPGATHLFRHACATHMLEGGADIRFIQALLGHANLETTQIYTHVSIEKLKAVHAATHPARLSRSEGESKAAEGAEDGGAVKNAAKALLDALASGEDENVLPAAEGVHVASKYWPRRRS
jgi:integrase/recombinase XerD